MLYESYEVMNLSKPKLANVFFSFSFYYYFEILKFEIWNLKFAVAVSDVLSCWPIWLQGQQIHQNVTEGIIIHNHTLVIQNVQRHWAGIYTCVASNDEGDGESNAIALHVRCKSLSLHLSDFYGFGFLFYLPKN